MPIPTLYIDGKVAVSGGAGSIGLGTAAISMHEYLASYLQEAGFTPGSGSTAQTLSIVGANLSISGGNTVSLASLQTTVNNTLTSTSTTEALSAAQGKTLNDADIASGAMSVNDMDLVLTKNDGTTITVSNVKADEVIVSTAALTGTAPANAQWGIDTTNGVAYYVNAGNWTPFPVATIDLSTTVSNQAGSNGTGLTTPTAAPAGTPDIGDLHIELYDDVTLYFTATAVNWTTPAVIEAARDLNNIYSTNGTLTSARIVEMGAFPLVFRNTSTVNQTVFSAGIQSTDEIRGKQDKQIAPFTIVDEVDFTTAEPALVAGQMYINTVTGTSSVTATAVTAGRLYQVVSTAVGYTETVPAEGYLTFNETTDSIKFFDGTAWQPLTTGLLNNFNGGQPTVTNDSNEGYAQGSLWLNTGRRVTYICLDATVGAAVWYPIGTTTDPVEVTDADLTPNRNVNLDFFLDLTAAAAASLNINAPTGGSLYTGQEISITINNNSGSDKTVVFNSAYKDQEGNLMGSVVVANNNTYKYRFSHARIAGLTDQYRLMSTTVATDKHFANTDLTGPTTDPRNHTFDAFLGIQGEGQKSIVSTQALTRSGYMTVNQGIVQMQASNQSGANNSTSGLDITNANGTSSVTTLQNQSPQTGKIISVVLDDEDLRLRTLGVVDATVTVGQIPVLQNSNGTVEFQNRKYSATFLATDFVDAGDGTSTIIITAATHGMGIDPMLSVYEVVGTTATKTEVDYSYDTATGDITMSVLTDAKFNGKYQIV
jgi:hypothetical protein